MLERPVLIPDYGLHRHDRAHMFVVNHQQRRLDQVKLPRNLYGCQPRVHWHEYSANTSNRMDKSDGLYAVFHSRRNSVARLNSLCRESGGLPISQAVQFTVTDRSPFKTHGHFAGSCQRTPVQPIFLH